MITYTLGFLALLWQLSTAQYIDLVNSYNQTFHGSISIGTPPTEFQVVFDTGSTLLWVFDQSCPRTLCTKERLKQYSQIDSSTGKENTGRFFADYNSGSYSGKNLHDQIKISELGSFPFDFGGVNYWNTAALSFFPADGLMGMLPGGFITKMHELKKLQQPFFAFILSWKAPSRLWIGNLPPTLPLSDFKFSDLIPGERKYTILLEDFGWDREPRSFLINEPKKQALIDTGSTFIKLPSSALKKMNLPPQVRCSTISRQPKIFFQFGMNKFELEPEYYYLSYSTSNLNYCDLALRVHPNDQVTIGLPFFMKYPTLFHIEDKKIGFAHSRNI